MLSVKGIYDGNVIVPLKKVDQKANSMVIITFLDEELPESKKELINNTKEKYVQLSKSFKFGESPDEEYAAELISVYNETFPRNS